MENIILANWDNLAELYQDKFMDLDLYNDTYDTFCALIHTPKAKVFEIGCGPGNITKYLLAQRPDFMIDAIDMAPNMVKLAKLNNPSANFEVMDCQAIGQVTQRYEGIMCGFCMPYLSKAACAQLIKDAATLLQQGGIFYTSVIEGDYSQSGFERNSRNEQMYVYYHQADYLQASLKAEGFEAIQLVRKSYAKSADTISTHLILIARKA